jgi:two-component system LytT family response regulator
MLQALIVDDEFKSRENLKNLLTDYCENVEVVGQAKNVKEGIDLIDYLTPDLVFLDVQMQDETGFDLLNHYAKHDFGVIFTTAYSEYAIKALRFAAIDYLLKPIDIEELQEAVKKAESRISDEKNFNYKLDILLQNLKPDNKSNFKIALPTINGLVFIKVSDILYCVGENNYTVIHAPNGKKYMVSKTLKEYEELLSDHNFFRIHKSYLVNLNEVKEYVKGEGGYVVMNDQKMLHVSKRKKESFLANITNPV